MADRDLRKTRYVVAAIMTLCIFLLGMMLGLIVEDKRIRSAKGLYEDQSLDFGTLQCLRHSRIISTPWRGQE
jgi:hypothetical protein